jgi:hypothetical protein
MLSDIPSKALLNRVEQELRLDSDLNDVDSDEAPSLEQTPREPRTYKSIDGTLYVEILIKKDKGKIRRLVLAARHRIRGSEKAE